MTVPARTDAADSADICRRRLEDAAADAAAALLLLAAAALLMLLMVRSPELDQVGFGLL